MKKFLVSILLIAVLLCMTTPASAKEKEPVGFQINLYPPGTYTYVVSENTAFHISHGWLPDLDMGSVGLFEFTLEVDGVLLKADFVQRTIDSENGTILIKWVYNFPDGMTGTHIFVGTWFVPCKLSITPSTCNTPNEKIAEGSSMATVTFVP